MAKAINNPSDLEQYGIFLLTGEACKLSARILCDVNENGARIIRDVFGLPHDSYLRANWNYSKGAVGSVMIPHVMLPMLAAYCLIDDGALWVVSPKTGGAYGFWPGEKDMFLETARIYEPVMDRVYQVMTDQPGAGLRNEHAMSGRTE